MDTLRRRLPSQNLRGVDAVMLEILAGDLVEKPMGQVAPENVADLFALCDQPAAPGNLRRRLANYRQRIAIEIGDIPNGAEFQALVADWKRVSGERVPETLRSVWTEECQKPRRSAAERALAADLLAGWADLEPAPFIISAPKIAPGRPPVQRAAAAPPVERPTRHGSAAAASPATPRVRTVSNPAVPRTVAPDDPEKRRWIREILFERLGAATDKGLLESVLLAGIKHRARELYPNLQPSDVMNVLQIMSQRGEVRVSAGRWALTVTRR